jgi:hypothetical protein
MRHRNGGRQGRRSLDAFWTALPILVGIGILVAGVRSGRIILPNPMASTLNMVLWEMDQENGLACERLGFASGTAQHASCKMELADLRRYDEQLLSGMQF